MKATQDRRRALKAIFLTLFLDLIGFSIIFPLFPAMLAWYAENDADSSTLRFFLGLIEHLQRFSGGGGGEAVPIVLFGGLLGSIYAVLQFLAAPLWGTLSDRFGRKPVLVVCIVGIALSYLGWFVAGSFLILILARILGGIMAGNISVATAAVADVTDEKTRSRGMALIGIAFGLGFILGPALGGLSAMWNLQESFPSLYGVNPFSFPALLAFLLSMANLFWVFLAFHETLPKSRRGASLTARTINPLKVLDAFRFPGAGVTIISYFVFLLIFSGIEFTLTFLAAERLGFTPMDNGFMFIFIGVTLALVQGGYVRRKAHRVGEKKMAIQGMVWIMPGLLLTGTTGSTLQLYAGLFCIAVGSAMTTPCLTSLVSLFTPATEQGKILGVFRSMGALSRAVGPIVACLIYWQLGARTAYVLGAAAMLVPVLIAVTIPGAEKGNGDPTGSPGSSPAAP